MKIKRFVATDMRQAMRDVRAEQGPDAVILSTRRLAEGIEIIAAIDYDESLVREAMGPPAAPRRTPLQPPVAESMPAGLPANAASATADGPQAAPASPAGAPRPPVEGPLLSGMCQELGSLREMLESQLASLAWNDLGRRQPQRAAILRELTRMGIDADVAQSLLADLPATLSNEQARYLPLGLLSRKLLASGRELTDIDGIVALVGPTGVGKTTTIAKLAARSVLRFGTDNVALVSTDHYRIGAGAQLEHYARLLGVPVFSADDAPSLQQVLTRVGDRRCVFVDTAGMSARDTRLNRQMQILRDARHDLRTCLVIAANAHAQAIDMAVQAYLPLQPRSAIVTKLDEAPSLGGVFSALIRNQLTLDYTTDGQRVPEDIATADARALVCRAAKPDTRADAAPDDMLMAERFGRLASALA